MPLYTSLEFSKKLKENGCEFLNKEGFVYAQNNNDSWELIRYDKRYGYFKDGSTIKRENLDENNLVIPAYDIFWDICVKYSKEFWEDTNCFVNPKIVPLLYKISTNVPMKEIEKYIEKNSIIFKKEVLEFN